jgi:putative FmdB family regulatory protein
VNLDKMPIYQYECGKCKRTGDYLLRMGCEPSQCQYCDEKSSFRRIIDGETFGFSGSDKTGSRDAHGNGKLFEVIAAVELPFKMPCGHPAVGLIAREKKD